MLSRQQELSKIAIAITSAIGLSLMHGGLHADEKPTQKDEHTIEKLVITSNPLNRTILESATPVSIIAGEDLESRIAPTLGETLKNVPGVHSTYFGPVSSSPIIRGLDGPRVKILQNGLDVSDASRIGPDHIVSTEAANATQIEVLRGPATLLYGNGAIGGVVNVVDNRLPTRAIEGVEGKASYLHDTVSSEDTVNVSVDGGTGNLAFHFDAFDRKTENYEIPGFAEAHGDDDHDEEHEGEEHDEHDEEQPGILENSFIDASGFSVGAGWVGEDVKFAVSFGSLESDYGIPGHAHEEEHDEEHEDEELEGEEHNEEDEIVFGRLSQDRYQALADWENLSGFISEVRFRAAYTDYEHSEIEGGEVGTTFENDTFETRLWAKHKSINGWQGVLGANYISNDFSALGEEAFTPASDSKTIAIFLLEEKRIDDLLWQLGMRVENAEITPDNSFFAAETNFNFDKRSYTSLSASVGASWAISANKTLAFNYARSERAPSAAEIFSNGLHIATNTYEVGAGFDIEMDGAEFEIVQSSRSVREEISDNLDLTFNYTGESIEASFSVFYNQIGDYLFERNTGLFFEEEHEEGETEEEHEEHSDEEIPIFIYSQQDAEIYGFEAEVDWHFNDNLRLESYADMTKAELDSGKSLPRIPPFRLGAELHWENEAWHAEVGATYYASQSDIAEFETETAGYTLVNASVNYYFDAFDSEIVLFAKANNLTNREARVHSSFIKDDAPLPGRSIVVGARVHF